MRAYERATLYPPTGTEYITASSTNFIKGKSSENNLLFTVCPHLFSALSRSLENKLLTLSHLKYTRIYSLSVQQKYI